MDGSERAAYRVPQYRAPDDTAFYHVLHGTVPGHQIDFMYCPEVPQGALQQTHFGHLTRLMRYIEPHQGATYGFALGNLSRDDVQHEPGHGGIAIVFALRVPGVIDHAGRDMPPYAHGIVAVDRSLEYVQLLEAMTRLHRRFVEREGAEDRRGDFYRAYVRIMEEQPESVEELLGNAIGEILDIPRPPRSGLGFDFEIDPEAQPPPPRIYVAHEDNEEFSKLADVAARMGAALYRSNVKWTSITTGREIDIPGGTSVRFVPASEVHAVRGPVHGLDDLPDDEGEIIHLLFGARRRTPKVAAPRRGWREKLAAQRSSAPRSERPPGPSADSQDSYEIDVDVDDAAATLVAGFDSDGAPGAPRPRSAPPPPSSRRDAGPDAGRIPATRRVPTGRFDRPALPAAADLPAPQTGATSSFDRPRLPSSAALPPPQTGALPPPQTGALPPPLTGALPPPLTGALPPPLTGATSSFDRPLLPAVAPITPATTTHLERSASSRSPRGRWIIAAAALAAVTVIVIVSVMAGITLEEAEATPDGGTTGSAE